MTFHYGGRSYSEADIKAALDFHVRQTGMPARAGTVAEIPEPMIGTLCYGCGERVPVEHRCWGIVEFPDPEEDGGEIPLPPEQE